MKTWNLFYLMSVCGIVGFSLLSGCSTPPPPTGAAQGRMRVEATTPGEVGVVEIQPGAWVEFSQLVAEQLVTDVSRNPTFADAEYRLTIIFGEIVNKTNRVSTNEFEQFRTDLRGVLVNTNRFTDKFVFRSNRESIERIREREMGSAGGSGITDLNPKYTYALSGEMYLTERFDSALYSLSFQLYNLETGELVWQNVPYQYKQAVSRR